MQVSREQFEKWVAEAVDQVPEKFQKRINNLAFFVEDFPNASQARKAGTREGRGALLLGLYEGYYQSKKLDIGIVLPDRITVFQKAVESLCQTEEELKNTVRRVIWHEIAHHFGSDESGARKAERRKTDNE